MKWNLFVFFYFETTLEIGISVSLNISKPIEDNYDKWGIAFTYYFAITFACFIIMITWLFRKIERMRNYEEQVGSLYENINFEDPWARLIAASFVVKRLFFVFLVVYLK